MENDKPNKKSCCLDCLYFNEVENTCIAFPFGIPDKYLKTDTKHTTPEKEQIVPAVFEEKYREY